MRRFLLAVLVLIWAGPAFAVQPNEMLKDEVLEARARVLSKELRCLVCQNQSIDDSDADVAREIRIFVRERLVAGDSDAQVMQAMTERYGNFVRLEPPFNAATAVLWLLPFGVLLFAGFLGLRAAKKREPVVEAALDDEDRKRVEAYLKDE